MLLDETLCQIKLNDLRKRLEENKASLKTKHNAEKTLHSGKYCRSVCELLLGYVDEIIVQIKNNCLNNFIMEKIKIAPSYGEIESEFNSKICPQIDWFSEILEQEILVAKCQDPNSKDRILEELSFKEYAKVKLNIFYKEFECELKEQCYRISHENEKFRTHQEANRLSQKSNVIACWALGIAGITAILSLILNYKAILSLLSK